MVVALTILCHCLNDLNAQFCVRKFAETGSVCEIH